MRDRVVKNIAMLIILILVIAINSTVLGADIIEPIKDFTGSGDVKSAGQKIAGVVSIIASATATIMLLWLAAKYMTAAPSEKADVKKSAAIYVTGAIILFATSGILKLIQEFAKDLLP